MSKYSNQQHRGYASKHEANVSANLHALERGGVIRDLQEQVKFELIPKQQGEQSCIYVADFTYYEINANGHGRDEFVVADAKGFRTPIYVIKRKLMLWRHGIRISEL